MALSKQYRVYIIGQYTKECSDNGPLGRALQCDFCGYWVRASCEGLTPDQYDSITYLTSEFDGLHPTVNCS